MRHLLHNALFQEAFGVTLPNSPAVAKALHLHFIKRLSTLLRCHRIILGCSSYVVSHFFALTRYKSFGCGDEVLGESKPISSVFFVISGRICVFQPGCNSCCKAVYSTSKPKTGSQCSCVPVLRYVEQVPPTLCTCVSLLSSQRGRGLHFRGIGHGAGKPPECTRVYRSRQASAALLKL
jgi:hypothetical protein